MVWTEADSAPYKVMHYNFGYPISIKEEKPLTITKNLGNPNLIYDEQGRIVREGKIKKGIYFLRDKNKLLLII